jgi:hypothetical protein
VTERPTEFTLRVSEHGDFGKIHDEGERRSANEIHSPGFHELDDDAFRLHEENVKTSGRGPAIRPLRDRDEQR